MGPYSAHLYRGRSTPSTCLVKGMHLSRARGAARPEQKVQNRDGATRASGKAYNAVAGAGTRLNWRCCAEVQGASAVASYAPARPVRLARRVHRFVSITKSGLPPGPLL